MKKNVNIKRILIPAGIALGFVVITAGVILVLGAVKFGGGKAVGVSSPPSPNGDMASHHAPPKPADNGRFQSLIGDSAPEFKLESYDGRKVDLKGLRGNNVVLFFSEGAMCYPSCWDQINAFTKDKGFSAKDTLILTIVVDSKTDWNEVVKKDPEIASAAVLFDTDRKVSNDYGALTVESSMHRGQFPGHTYVVIDKEGVVRYGLDDPQMGINNGRLLAQIDKL